MQFLDKAAPSASVKIMMLGRAALVDKLTVPESLADIGGMLRAAGRSLGIVIDTPRLDPKVHLEEQTDNVIEALEAAIRLQGWWNENGPILLGWANTPLPLNR